MVHIHAMVRCFTSQKGNAISCGMSSRGALGPFVFPGWGCCEVFTGRGQGGFERPLAKLPYHSSLYTESWLESQGALNRIWNLGPQIQQTYLLPLLTSATRDSFTANGPIPAAKTGSQPVLLAGVGRALLPPKSEVRGSLPVGQDVHPARCLGRTSRSRDRARFAQSHPP
jgi:hypothetical protein